MGKIKIFKPTNGHTFVSPNKSGKFKFQIPDFRNLDKKMKKELIKGVRA